MPTCAIVLAHSSDNTVPGSRDDFSTGQLITVSNHDNTGVVYWLYELFEKPTGSTATLSSTSAQTTTFTPDVVGTYLVRLTINNNQTNEVGAACKTTHLHYRIPGPNESSQYDVTAIPPATSDSGWFPALEDALKKLDDGYGNLLAGGGGGAQSMQAAYDGGPTINMHTFGGESGVLGVSMLATTDGATSSMFTCWDSMGNVFVDINDNNGGLAYAYIRRLKISGVNITASGGNTGDIWTYNDGTSTWAPVKPTFVSGAGSGSASQVAFWTNTNTITGASSFTFVDGYGLTLGNDLLFTNTVDHNIKVTDTATNNDGYGLTIKSGKALATGTTGKTGGLILIQAADGYSGSETGGTGGGITLQAGICAGGGPGDIQVLPGATGSVFIGGTTTDKVAFYGVGAVTQPNTTGSTTVTSAGAGTPILADTTSTGGTGSTAYTVSDIIKHLKELGLIAA